MACQEEWSPLPSSWVGSAYTRNTDFYPLGTMFKHTETVIIPSPMLALLDTLPSILLATNKVPISSWNSICTKKLTVPSGSWYQCQTTPLKGCTLFYVKPIGFIFLYFNIQFILKEDNSYTDGDNETYDPQWWWLQWWKNNGDESDITNNDPFTGLHKQLQHKSQEPPEIPGVDKPELPGVEETSNTT